MTYDELLLKTTAGEPTSKGESGVPARDATWGSINVNW